MLFRGENDSERVRMGVNRSSETGPILDLAKCPNYYFHRFLCVFQQLTSFGAILKRIRREGARVVRLKRPRPFGAQKALEDCSLKNAFGR